MLNLMIVDDEPIILKGLINIIEKGSTPCSEIVCAHDGIEALEKMQDFRPDLVITDIQMPEMNGLELINEAKSRELCKRFILLTGFDHTEYLRKAIRCKVIDYLLKPINKIELYDVLANVSIEMLGEASARQAPWTGSGPGEKDPTFARIESSGPMSRNVEKIIHYIHENYALDLSLDQIAEHVYLHPNYISSLFRKETGITFIHYLHLYRIQKAKQLMTKHQEMSFHQISEKVGYENVRHFFSIFKKHCGITPGDYRARQHG
ncbi:response regulator transcription factor [Cohnella cellulosilytica]|uniref:Response regulator n=1 Tax=Cohnella cellulosilytica TaxID=986710 RepID=A0ABW2FHQ2_9BACL